MNITFVIASLRTGGAERVAATLANGFASQGHALTVVTFEPCDRKPFYGLAPGIVHRCAGADRAGGRLKANVERIRLLRGEIRRSAPDIVLSFIDQTNVLTLMATRGLGIPVVVTEHTPPRCYPLGAIWKALRRLTYPLADAVVGVSRGVIESFPPQIRKRARVIYNPIDIAAITRAAVKPDRPASRRKTLVTVGRLHEEKGIDLLVDAFSRVSPKHADWELQVWGEGLQETALKALCERRGLGERVIFRGTTAEIYSELKADDLFALSSRYEGFGIALCEAMACGLPVVSFDCPVGPREIITDGKDGILVPGEDVTALASALDRLMSDPDEGRVLASRAAGTVKRFDLPVILGAWHRLFEELRATAGTGSRKQEKR